MLEAERKEREHLDQQRVQAEKLQLQQKMKLNMQAAMSKKVPTKYTFDMLNTDDDTDDEANPVANRPRPPEWSTRKTPLG